MINILKFSIVLIALAVPTCASAQSGAGFGIDDLDYSAFHTQYKYEVECKSNERGGRQGNIICVYKDIKHNTMNNGLQPYSITRHSGGVSMGVDNSTVRTPSSRNRQQQIRKQVRDRERRDFFERRQAERMAAAREAAQRRRIEQARRIEEDNRRATAAYMAKNAQLQGLTNQRLASDQWHANEGRAATRQVARQQIGAPHGMRISQRQQATAMTGASRARMLQANRQRIQQRDPEPKIYRPRPPKAVRQRPNPYNGKYVFTGRATKSSIFIERDPRLPIVGSSRGPSMTGGGSQFRLSPHAVVTTGQPVRSPSFDMPGKIPPPVTRITKPMTRDEILAEMLGPDPN